MDGVEAHYTRADVLPGVLAGLRRAGADPDAPTVDDLAPFDQMHLGGIDAVRELVALLGLGPGDHLLDVGSGLGGPARTVADATGCRVTGVDLTASLVEAARALTERAGLAGRVAFVNGDAARTGLPDGSATAAWQIHSGMNIPDKRAVFAEVRRVLRTGSPFLVHDVMTGPAALPPPYPLPWAARPALSRLEPPDAYVEWLMDAGFRVGGVTSRRAEALAFLSRAVRGREEGPVRPGVPPEEVDRRFANLRTAIADHRLTVQVIAAKAV